MNRSAFRTGGLLYCKTHDPGKVLSQYERRVVKREALLGQSCVKCGKAFLEDAPEPVRRDPFRENFEADVKAGRAHPMAGDLFDGLERGK